ncbi:DUF397 domain-containing protein [Streptomyces roseirectus]|uniref:DUF397 domain-containing protein n=1 Tax=Streptomyces roseirectus TaxID=2768066 RepID=A0A7H0IF42_9ACTN|nr:DUF397 domain-containing protein [Streptomyces roseirectus]QNP71408.1 DUF397 domain-containing protein [Streptomyces roseirectus]
MTTEVSLRWVKSSYSDNGGNCVEVALWAKSSYSDNGGDCVEIAVNMAPQGTVPIRDSKTPHGPELAISAPAFTSFTESLKADKPTA